MKDRPFNPADWYWFVGGDETRAYASARRVYVDVGDAGFRTWSSAALPSRIASEAELRDVLAAYGLTFADDQPPAAPRDLAAELDQLKADLARAKAAEAVLIEKSVVTKGEIDAKVPEVGEITVDAKK